LENALGKKEKERAATKRRPEGKGEPAAQGLLLLARKQLPWEETNPLFLKVESTGEGPGREGQVAWSWTEGKVFGGETGAFGKAFEWFAEGPMQR